MKKLQMLFLLLTISCTGNVKQEKEIKNSDTAVVQKQPVNNKVPQRLILGGPVENYIASLSKSIKDPKYSQNFDSIEVYHRNLFIGKKTFLAPDCTKILVIVDYPIIGMIKWKESNPTQKSIKEKAANRSYKYGILKKSKLYQLDFAIPNLSFTDDCCTIKYANGILTEGINKTKTIYTEVTTE